MNLRWDDQTAILGEPQPAPPRHHLPRRRLFPALNGWADVRDMGAFCFFAALALLVLTLAVIIILKSTGVA